MAKKSTQLQIEYKKQVKRLKQAIRRAEKRGYIVPENILPKQPKRVTTKSVERLKKITTKEIYTKSEKLDFETGELIPGEEARKRERSESAKKSAETRKIKNKERENYYKNRKQQEYYKKKKEKYASFSDSVISEYIRQISRFPPKVADIVINALKRAIKNFGKDAVAYRLEFTSESLSEYLSNVGLFGDSIQAILAYCDAVFSDMPGMNNEDLIDISEIMDSESYSE